MGIEKKLAGALFAASLASSGVEAKEPTFNERLIPDERGATTEMIKDDKESDIERGKPVEVRSAKEAMELYMQCIQLWTECGIDIKVITVNSAEEYATSTYGSAAASQEDRVTAELRRLSRERYDLPGGEEVNLTQLRNSLGDIVITRAVSKDLESRVYTLKPKGKKIKNA